MPCKSACPLIFSVENSLHQKYTEVAGKAHRIIGMLVAKGSSLTSHLKQEYHQCWVTSDVALYSQVLKTFKAGDATVSLGPCSNAALPCQGRSSLCQKQEIL